MTIENFPSALKPYYSYIQAPDLAPDGYVPTTAGFTFRYITSPVFKSLTDTSHITNFQYGFSNSTFITCTPIDLSSATNIENLFISCSIVAAPELDFPNAKSCYNMFSSCSSLAYVPDYNTSHVTKFSSMFQYCSKLVNAPNLDYSSATDVGSMFSNCTNLSVVGNMNTKLCTTLNSLFSGCTKLKSVGTIDADSVKDVGYMFSGNKYHFKDFGGLINLGKQSSVSGTSNLFSSCYVLTRQSWLNIFNGLYDRTTAGLSILTLTIPAIAKTILSDEDIAIATNKGWTLS